MRVFGWAFSVDKDQPPAMKRHREGQNVQIFLKILESRRNSNAEAITIVVTTSIGSEILDVVASVQINVIRNFQIKSNIGVKKIFAN